MCVTIGVELVIQTEIGVSVDNGTYFAVVFFHVLHTVVSFLHRTLEMCRIRHILAYSHTAQYE